MKGKNENALAREYAKLKARGMIAFNAIRPAWYLALSATGIYLAYSYLQNYEWHHMTIAWVLPLGIGVYSLYAFYKSVSAIVSIRDWLKSDDDDAWANVDDVKPHVRIAPPWLRAKYLARKSSLTKANRR